MLQHFFRTFKAHKMYEVSFYKNIADTQSKVVIKITDFLNAIKGGKYKKQIKGRGRTSLNLYTIERGLHFNYTRSPVWHIQRNCIANIVFSTTASSL